MFKIGRKAPDLERMKLQSEIQKEKSELRRKKLENRLKMLGKAGGRGGSVKNPKKMKRELDDDDDVLDDLETETEQDDKRPPSYSNLKPGGFVTKAEDRKGRLEKRRVKWKDDDDDDGDRQETEQERLE